MNDGSKPTTKKNKNNNNIIRFCVISCGGKSPHYWI